jgi:plasmid stability protein
MKSCVEACKFGVKGFNYPCSCPGMSRAISLLSINRRNLAMAQLIVRNIEEELVRELKMRATKNGHSAEEEHRNILRQALLPEPPGSSLKDLLASMPDVGDDEDFERISDRGRAVDL